MGSRPAASTIAQPVTPVCGPAVARLQSSDQAASGSPVCPHVATTARSHVEVRAGRGKGYGFVLAERDVHGQFDAEENIQRCRQLKRVAGAEPETMFAEEHKGTKHMDSVRPVPDVHVGYVTAGDRRVVGGYRRGAPTAKHDEDLNELCSRAGDNDRSCDGHVKPIRSADGSLECRAAALAQSENVAPTDAIDRPHIPRNLGRHESNAWRKTRVRRHGCSSKSDDYAAEDFVHTRPCWLKRCAKRRAM
jgi:hypothetical protein